MSPGRRALVVAFVLTLPFVTPRVRAADEIQYFSSLRSLFFDGDLDYENEYRHFYARDPEGLQGFKGTFLERRDPVSGRHINFATLGAALLWSPFLGVAHVGVLAARALGAGVAADGYSFPYLAAVSLASAIYAFAGLLLIHEMLVREGGFDDRLAALGVLGAWLATPVVYYMTIAPGFGHAPSLFAVSLLLWLSFRARRRGSAASFLLCGLAGGLAGLVREQDALFLVFPAGLVAWDFVKSRALGRALQRAAVLAMGALLVLAPQLAAYKALTGRFGPSTFVTRKMSWSSPHAFEVLFDPGHGLFLWSPILFAASVGLIFWAWRRRDVVAALLVLLVLLQVWINGAVESWHMAGAFGARRFIAATPAFAFGLAALLETLRRRAGEVAPVLLVLLCAWWNLSLMVQFGLKLMDRQRLEWPRVAVNQVTEVPLHLIRAGRLFFTDRERLAREGP